MSRVVAALAVVLALVGGVLVLTAASTDSGQAKTFKIELDNAFGLVTGGDFRVGGVKAGETTGFEVKRTPSGPKAFVSVKVDEPGLADLRRDAHCGIRPQSLIGEYYVDCQPGSSPRRLRSGATIPVSQTESTIPLDLVTDILRRPYRDRLRLILTELGTGLAGRPADVAAALRRAHPGLRETSKVLKVLGDQNRTIEAFLRDSDAVVAELAARRQDVARFVASAGDTAAIAATRREQLRQTVHELPGFLGELRPTMVRLGELADAQLPLLTDLRRGAPDLTELLRRLAPFSRAGLPALKALGGASAVGTRAFRRGSDEIAVLRKLATDAPTTAKPLRQFLQTIDDRSRGVVSDPRAAASAPPAPDKTAPDPGRGFTGMEAFWNYPFWQTLSLNGYDRYSHILRLGLTVNKCTPFVNKAPSTGAERQLFRDCNQWLGPNQPGITTPDFSATATAARKLRRSPKRARKVGERRAPGQPDAGPLPGQPDVSKPQVTLPPPVKKLLDRLGVPAPKTPSAPSLLNGLLGAPRDSTPPGPAGRLLDFLLGP